MTAATMVRILGPLAVERNGTDLPLPGGRVRSLLALLVCDIGQRLSAERAIDILWGADDTPDDPLATVRVVVSRLRNALGDDERVLVMSEAGGYRLAIEPEQIDATQFTMLLDEAKTAHATGMSREALDTLDAALALWRGDALSGVAHNDVVQAYADQLEGTRLDALEQRADLLIHLGRHDEVVRHGRALVALHPLHERFHEQLMLAHYRAGRQNEALAAFRHARAVLADQLGVDPGRRLTDLHAALLHNDVTSGSPLDDSGLDRRARARPASAARLQPSQLIGRSHAVMAASALLIRQRHLTIVGRSGVGKSALAGEVAEVAGANLADGLRSVSLDDARTEDDVCRRVAASCSDLDEPVSSRDALVSALANRVLVLLLDDCDTAADACASLVDSLLASCPNVVVLATSCRPLGSDGERLYRLSGLDVPPVRDDISASAIREHDAVRLLLAQLDGTTATADELMASPHAVARLTRLVDGNPLALQLAAARLRSVSLPILLTEMTTSGALDALRDPRRRVRRHQSLRASIDHTAGFLDDKAMDTLTRLSVFGDQFDLEAACVVCATDDLPRPAFEAAIGALVDAGLLDPPDAAGRYRLPRAVASYARERLLVGPNSQAIHRRQVEHLLEGAMAAVAGLRSSDQAGHLAWLQAESHHIRAALVWCAASGDKSLGLRLVNELWLYWLSFGHARQGRVWLVRALVEHERQPAALAARGLAGSAVLALAEGDVEQAGRFADAACAVEGATHDAFVVATCEGVRGLVAARTGAFDKAATKLQDSQRTFFAAGHQWEARRVGLGLAELLRRSGNAQRAATAAERTAAAFADQGDRWSAAEASAVSALALLDLGDVSAAEDKLLTALDTLRPAAGIGGARTALRGLARVAAAQGRHEQAVRLLSAANAGAPTWSELLVNLEPAAHLAELTMVSGGLDRTTIDRQWRAGQHLVLPRAIDEALRPAI